MRHGAGLVGKPAEAVTYLRGFMRFHSGGIPNVPRDEVVPADRLIVHLLAGVESSHAACPLVTSDRQSTS
jgi:hypothetical protein